METPGEFLRKKREAAGRSLEEIAGLTNLRVDVLRNLEADLFNFAPATVYVVGALTAYAKALGVDPSDVLERYHALSAPRPPPVAREVVRESPRKPEPRRIGLPFRARWIGVAAAVIAVVVVAALLLRRLPPPPPPRVESRPPEMDWPAPPETTAVGAVPVDAPRPRVVLELTVRESTWVGLEMDGVRRYSALLGPGAWKRWEADSMFAVKVGNAAGVTLTLDGKPVDLPQEPGRVVILGLTSEGARRLQAGEAFHAPAADSLAPEPQ